MKLRLLALLLFALGSAGWAQDTRTVVFHTQPEGASIYAEVSGTRKYEKYLGRSGEPIHLDTASLRGRTSIQLVFKLEGYRDRVETVGNYYFNDRDRYPEEGALVLEPLNALVPAIVWVKNHTALVTVAGLLCLAGAGWGFRHWRKVRDRLNRAKVLQEFEARADTADPRIMSQLGGYRILEKLGAGGMATVYRAVPDDQLEADGVAIKIIRPDIVDEKLRARFRQEIRLSSQLTHPAVVEVFDFGDQEGLLYLVMELVRGQTLGELIPAGGMDPEKGWKLLSQVFDAVAFAHDKGILHRDLKPDNLMVTEGDRIKIMDFGLAKGLDSPALTKTGHALGTPLYMAPEQVRGIKADTGADQYALACIVVETLTGRPPFEDDEEVSVLMKKMNEPAPSLHERRPELPPELDPVVSRMMRLESKDRYPDIRSAAEALVRALGL